MEENPKDERKKAKDRSPNYPGIDLENALEKARIIREKEGKHYAPVEVVLRHWGYVPKSSGGLVALSALKKFGLIDEQGRGSSRQIKLSELALKVLLDDREDSVERMEAIKEAALGPVIHRKLWETYGGELPSHQNLFLRLRKDEGFTDNAAEDLIREFERTIEFAKLIKSDIISGQGKDINSTDRENKMTSSSSGLEIKQGDIFDFGSLLSQKAERKTIEIPIPYSPTEWVKVQMAYPLSEEAWKQMMTILEAYKPSLVTKPKENSGKKEN